MSRKKNGSLPSGSSWWAPRRPARISTSRETPDSVNVEALKKRDLKQLVTASGTIQAKRFVNISAVQMGRVTRLAVEEGDRVKAGQFLLEIDPNTLRGTVQRGEAAVAGARAGLEQANVNVETANANLQLARDQVKRQRDLWAQQLTTKRAARQGGMRAEGTRNRAAGARRPRSPRREQMIRQESASLVTSQYNLRQVTLVAPFDGIVTRRNIEEGENVVVGTMNNAGTQLMTVADMSIIEAEVEVDETDIPSVQIGQIGKITIDALPDKPSPARSPRSATARSSTAAAPGRTAGDELQGDRAARRQIPEVRPGFTCSATITTATRNGLAFGADSGDGRSRGGARPEGPDRPRAARRKGQAPQAARRRMLRRPQAAELKPGQTRKEIEGVFVFETTSRRSCR